MSTQVMYLRVDSEVHKLICDIRDETKLSLNFIASYLLRKGAGLPLDNAIEAALEKHMKGGESL